MKLNGYDIIIANTYPKMTLAANVPVTLEFREEINAWMLEFFGWFCLVKKGEVLVCERSKRIIVHPADYAKLTQAYHYTKIGIFP